MKKNLLSIVFVLFFMSIHAQKAGFTIGQSDKCVPSTITFTDTSTGTPTSYLWIFGDGGISTIKNPSRPYTTAGTYTVTLIAYYSGGISDTCRAVINVYNPPTFTFKKLNDSICPGGSVSFSSTITLPTNPNNIVSYSWDFGDGGSSTLPNPTYQYMNIPNLPVRYTVSLTIIDVNNCSSKIIDSNYIYVKPKPIVDFDVNKQYFCPPDVPASVTFTNKTTVTTNNTYLWIISDGRTSTAANPTLNFTNLGNYSVSLMATSPEGCSNTLSKPQVVILTVFDPKIDVSDTTFCSVPAKVTFRGVSTGSNNSYTWDFGDGETGTSSLQSITHTYDNAGTYIVTLIGNFRNGSCFAYDTIRIHVYDAIDPDSVFSINGSTSIPDTVLCDFQFANPVVFRNTMPYTSTDDFGLGYTNWWFGDGDSITGRTAVSHIFSSDTDRYTITMRARTPYGCPLEITRTIWYHSYVPVRGGFFMNNPYPTASPFYEGCVPLTLDPLPALYIIQKCWDSKAVTFIWDWGDGSPRDTVVDSVAVNCCPCSLGEDWIIPLNNVTHTYTQIGIYNVTLTFINEAGCPYTIHFGKVKVGAPPKVGFILDSNYFEWCLSTFPNINVHGFDSVDNQGNPIAGVAAEYYNWSVNGILMVDAMSETKLAAVVTGYMHICLIPENYGCPGEKICVDSVAYACPPLANIDLVTYNPPYPNPKHPAYLACEFPLEVEFVDSSYLATSRLWFFGDAEDLMSQSTDTSMQPTFVYTQKPDFLSWRNKREIIVRLVAYNDDSVDVNSPTYNRCKFCVDTSYVSIQLSEGNPKLTVSDVCQGSTATFIDSGTYDIGIRSWGLRLFPQNPFNTEFNSRDSIYSSVRYDPLYGGPPYIDIQDEGFSLFFKEMDNYTVTYLATDSLNCKFWDTINFSIFPQSTLAFVSSKDGINFAYKKDTLCANSNDVLYLRDTSCTPPPFENAKIIYRGWEINKLNSSSKHIIFNETAEGMYDVNLYIVNEYNCISDSVFENQILINRITAGFSPGNPWYCNHTVVDFHDRSFISPRDYNRDTKLIYIWDFGDSTPHYTSTPEDLETRIVYHTYNLRKLPDTVTVTLTVSLPDGSCSATYTNTVLILGPVASFIDDGHRFPCPESGRSINFQSTSTGSPTLYYWNFGDPLSGTANESHLKNPVHDYRCVGWYDIIHIVQDSMKCADTLIIPSHIFIDGPVGDVLYGELSGCVEHTVLFTPEITWADSIWINPDRAALIKDGDTNINNTHLYTYTIPKEYVPYFYLIKWTLDENNDSVRCVVEWEGRDTIYVINIIPDFESDSIYCPNYAEFPNTTIVVPKMLPIDSAMWSFGNGDTLFAINGYTNYDAIGTYTVNMTVYVKKCTKQISKNIEIIDLSNTILTEPDSANGCGNEVSVLFTAILADEIPDMFSPQYKWKFDDNDTITGNSAPKTFYYSGFYPYQTTVYFGSNCILTYFDTIYIRTYGYPTAEFEPTPQTVNYGEEIHFIDKTITGEGNVIAWYWDFGDANSSNQQSPKHTYIGTSGYVTVFMRVEDEFGCIDSIKHDVLILETLDFPNILTPFGSDGKRYYFRPIEEKGYFKEFKIIIYDRWGMKVWQNSCKDPNCPDYGDSFWWDGNNKFGKPVNDGVYFWVVYAAPLSGTKPIIKNGSVTVVNEGGK